MGGAAASASRKRVVGGGATAAPVPTRLAEASRALGGNTSTAEQYAFAGVACVLDHLRLRASPFCNSSDTADTEDGTGKVENVVRAPPQDEGTTAPATTILYCRRGTIGSPTRLRFANNDAGRLAAGGGDGRVSVSLVSPPARASLLCMLTGHTGPVVDLAWSSDNDHLLTASLDGTARVWCLAKAVCVRQFPPECENSEKQQQKPNSPLYAAEFAPSNNNLFVVGGGRHASGLLRSVNLSTGLCQSTLRLSAPVSCLTFGCQPDACSQLWLGDTAGCLHQCRLDPLTGRLTHLTSMTLASAVPLASVQARSWLSREARDPCLLVCTAESAVLLYSLGDSGDGSAEEAADISAVAASRPALRRSLPVPRPTRAAFCPLMSFRQGACVVCASANTEVYIVDVTRDSRPIVNQLQGHASPVTDVAFNYDESLLASADDQGTVIIWRRA